MTAYEVALFLHIAAVLAVYGPPLAYPVVVPYLRRRHPEALPGLHAVQYRLNLMVGVPASTLLFLAGAYMAQDRGLWSQRWVQVGVTNFALISVLGAAVIVPATRRLAQGGDDYDRVYRRYLAVERLLGLLVMANIFLMATKPT